MNRMVTASRLKVNDIIRMVDRTGDRPVFYNLVVASVRIDRTRKPVRVRVLAFPDRYVDRPLPAEQDFRANERVEIARPADHA